MTPYMSYSIHIVYFVEMYYVTRIQLNEFWREARTNQQQF